MLSLSLFCFVFLLPAASVAKKERKENSHRFGVLKHCDSRSFVTLFSSTLFAKKRKKGENI